MAKNRRNDRQGVTGSAIAVPALAFVLGAVFVSPGPAVAAIAGRDAAHCIAGEPTAQVRVAGFKQPSGTVQVTFYSSDGWLKKGKSLRKVRVPISQPGSIDICVGVPGPGPYGVAVHHDLNGNGNRDRADGGGYSRNPPVSLTSLRPRFVLASFEVSASPRLVPVELLYLHGLRIGPERSSVKG